jgi:protein-L-isoaspartate(D-aspartate) O-methyltransferase
MDSLVRQYQDLLLEQIRAGLKPPASEALVSAYRAVPRHRFVERYRQIGVASWQDVTAANLLEHLATLYRNSALVIAGEESDAFGATISQPEFVLQMLTLLDPRPGQRVLEVGAGSGWNAALMGHLVGESGRVVSIEPVKELCSRARAALARVGSTNVSIIEGDGADGFAPEAPYDRIVFTVGMSHLPRALVSQLAPGGIMLFVMKSAGGANLLLSLEQQGKSLESRAIIPCKFVPAQGKAHLDSLEPANLEEAPEWASLRTQEVSRRSYWFGATGRAAHVATTFPVRWFLSITEPGYRDFLPLDVGGAAHFGLWGPDRRSLVVASAGELIAYGSNWAEQRLLERLRQWLDLGMPSAAAFRLSVHPAEALLPAREGEWITRFPEAQFVWRAAGAA